MNDDLPKIKQYHCPWCGQNSDATLTTCPSCGSPTDLRLVTSKGGWSERPSIKDMTKIQFNHSSCQIAGKYAPVADFNLAAEDSIYFARNVMLWKDEKIEIKTSINLRRIIDTLLAGMPLCMAHATGPGRIAFSKDIPGDLIALPLQTGRSLDVRKHAFLVATHSIDYDWFLSSIWFKTRQGKNIDSHFPVGQYMDRFTATNEPGLLLLHGGGHVFFRDLDIGQSILIKPTSLLYKDTTVKMHLHMERPTGVEQNLFNKQLNQHVWLQLLGPGRVAIQSRFAPLDGENGNIYTVGPLTTLKGW